MSKWIRMLAVALTAVMLSTLAAGQEEVVSQASAETPEQGKPESEMTEAEKEKAAREKAIQDAFALPVQTNELKGWPEGPGTYGDSAIVMDVGSGAILYAKNIDQREYPASITKVLTALLAFQYGNMESAVTISPEAMACLRPGYASIGVGAGQVISLEQAMYAMLLASANEIAYAVGETVAAGQGQSYDWFIAQMNETCRQLGGENSNFVNTNGMFDENHYTCARDMALIGRALFQYPMFFQICQTQEYMIPLSPTVEEHVFQQKHHMLLVGNKDYYEYAVAGKTGYTEDAENTLITLADNGERQLVCVILKTYSGHTYPDTRGLLDYGFSHFQKEPVAEHDALGDYERIQENAYVMLPEGISFEDLDREILLHEDGTDDATVTYYYEDMPVGTCEVAVSENYYNKEKKAEEEPKEVVKEKKEDPEKEKKDKSERYKAVAAVGVSAILILCVVIAGIVTHISKVRNEKRRKNP